MPWPEPQRRAIFLDTQRRKGTKAAKTLMRKHKGKKKVDLNPSRTQQAFDSKRTLPGRGPSWQKKKSKKDKFRQTLSEHDKASSQSLKEHADSASFGRTPSGVSGPAKQVVGQRGAYQANDTGRGPLNPSRTKESFKKGKKKGRFKQQASAFIRRQQSY